jgi:hypothetical protein
MLDGTEDGGAIAPEGDDDNDPLQELQLASSSDSPRSSTPTANPPPRDTTITANPTADAANQELPGPAHFSQAAGRRRTSIARSNGSQLDDLLQISLLQMEEEREERREERKRRMELKEEEKEYERRKEEKREEEQRRQHEQDRLRQERFEQQQLQFQQMFMMIMAKSINTEDKQTAS